MDIDLQEHLLSNIEASIDRHNNTVNERFTRLPTDLIHRILQFLTLEEVHDLTLASTAIYRACYNSPQGQLHHQHFCKRTLLEQRFQYLLNNTNLTVHNLTSMYFLFIRMSSGEIISYFNDNPKVTSLIGIEQFTSPKTGMISFQIEPNTADVDCCFNLLFDKCRYVMVIHFHGINNPTVMIYQYYLKINRIDIRYFSHINDLSFIEQIMNFGKMEFDNTTWVSTDIRNER